MTRILISVSLLLAGCGASPALAPDDLQLRERASADLACPAGDLELERITEGEARVEGCGLSGIYIELCEIDLLGADRYQAHCFWVPRAGSDTGVHRF